MQSLAFGILICIVGVASWQDHDNDSDFLQHPHHNDGTIQSRALTFALQPPTLSAQPEYTRMHSLIRHVSRHSHSHARLLSLHSRRSFGNSDGNDGVVLRQLDLLGQPALAYSVNISIGTPPQYMLAIVDTGSSNLAVSAKVNDDSPATYKMSASSSSQDLNKRFTVRYAVANFTAERVRDKLAFPQLEESGITVEFGAMVESQDFFERGSIYSGILGLAYPSLAAPRDDPIPPLLQQLKTASGVQPVLTIRLCSSPQLEVLSGSTMTIGDVDASGTLPSDSVAADNNNVDNSSDSSVFAYTPIPTTARSYYSVQVLQMRVNNVVLNVSCQTYNTPLYSIVDTGTTDLIVPPEAHAGIVTELNKIFRLSDREKELFFNSQGGVKLAPSKLQGLPPIYISLPHEDLNSTFELEVQPWSYMRLVEEHQDGNIYVFAIVTENGVAGVTIGMAVLTNYVTVFDQIRHRVGFATSNCGGYQGTTVGSHPIAQHLPVPDGITNISSECKPVPVTGDDDDIPLLWVYITIGACLFVVLIIGLYLSIKMQRWHRHSLVTGHDDRDDLLEITDGDSGEVDFGYGAQIRPRLISINQEATPTPAAPLPVMPLSSKSCRRFPNARRSGLSAVVWGVIC
eukprot:TRINITY_DN11999_c0_g2_i1.p1 TRINITY_DN11999_c0_g2~~TRINITY_DN11999_c0_g2_i1.p1  ORF type:complete len:627 (+),score=134.13 TRINITY_DN11999_c0_g2_i1:50-1930(+)